MSRFSPPPVSVSATSLRESHSDAAEHHGGDAHAMSELYKQVQTIYRSVKEAGRPASPDTPATAGSAASSAPDSHRVVRPMTGAAARGRSPVPIPERKPWGYASPARRPSPASTPRTQGRAVTPMAVDEREAHVTKPQQPVTSTRRNTPPSKPQLAPTAVPVARNKPSPTAAARKPSPVNHPRRGSSPLPPAGPSAPRSRAASPASVAPAAITELEKRVAALEDALADSNLAREGLERRLREQDAAVHATLDRVEERAMSAESHALSLASQVQFAIAWIRQVDNHIADEREDIDRTPPASVGNATDADASVSRRLDMSEDAASRLPPSPPMHLRPMDTAE